MKKKVIKYVEKAVAAVAAARSFKDLELPEIGVELPREKAFGDFSSNIAMQLAGRWKDNPRKIGAALKDELDNIRKYLDIEKIRFGDRLIVEEIVEGASLERKIPNLILQPIYENAIKHGVNESTDTVTITTDCSIENDELIIIISNNYSAGNLSKKGKGIGIDNIRKRLLLHYKRTDLIEIEKSSYHFKVTLKIPN